LNRFIKYQSRFFIVILFSHTISFSQNSSKNLLKYNYQLNYEEQNIFSDNIFYTLGAITGATSLLFILDESIRKEISKSKLHKNNTFLEIGHNYGEFYYSLGLSGIMYVSHFILKDDKIGRTAKSLFEALLVSGAVSITFKYIFGRSRPYREDGVAKFNWFETKNIFNSLPSGHVITAFTTSTVLAKSFDNLYVSIFLYSLAGLTAYQRIESDNHWFSDLFLGASIGVLAGEFFSSKNFTDNSKNVNFNLIPFISESFSH